MMSPRERILATLRGEPVDKLPFFHYWRHLQTGQIERECRNKGMGICWVRPCYTMAMPNVEIIEKRESTTNRATLVRTYHTPVGTVSEREVLDSGTGQWHGTRSWRDITPWKTERLIKEPKDYEVVRFMVEDTKYKADYFPIKQAKEWLGEEGVAIAGLRHSPMQMLMIDWIGSESGLFFIHLLKHRSKVEELYLTLCRSYQPLYEIAADSPADIILYGDNIDGVLVNPQIFKQYFMPVYSKCANVLHEKDKIMGTHMDGRLNVLKELIARCPQDLIEAFHPPPLGDLQLHEALTLWKNKTVWMGFPAPIYVMGSDSVKRFLLSLLKNIIPAERLAIIASTENLVSNENLLMMASILEKFHFPLTEQVIDQIHISSRL